MDKKKKTLLPIDNLVLTPYRFLAARFPHEPFRKSGELLGLPIYVSGRTAVLAGFIGYPALLTALLFIENARQVRIFFLGTAGLLPPVDISPSSGIYSVRSVGPDSVLEKIFPARSFKLPTPWKDCYREASVISTDTPLRETGEWLRENSGRAELVEMELFGLCSHFDNVAAAVLIGSDIVGAGAQAFFPRREVEANLKAAFAAIVRYCHES